MIDTPHHIVGSGFLILVAMMLVILKDISHEIQSIHRSISFIHGFCIQDQSTPFAVHVRRHYYKK